MAVNLDKSYSVWLHFTDGSVEHGIGWPGQFTVRMFPEQIAFLEEQFGRKLARICTDTEDNEVWKRPEIDRFTSKMTCHPTVSHASCDDCTWQKTTDDPSSVGSAAREHAAETGHVVFGMDRASWTAERR